MKTLRMCIETVISDCYLFFNHVVRKKYIKNRRKTESSSFSLFSHLIHHQLCSGVCIEREDATKYYSSYTHKQKAKRHTKCLFFNQEKDN